MTTTRERPGEAIVAGEREPGLARRLLNRYASVLTGLLGIVIVLAIWQLLGVTKWHRGAVPPFTKVMHEITSDWAFYRRNLAVTVREAAKGWLWGNGLAIALAVAFVQVPIIERALMKVAIAAYCLPIIAIGPILIIQYNGDTPKVILAALTCFFTTLIGMLLGLRSADPSSLDLVRAYGGGSWLQLRKVRLKASLPGLFAGLRIAAPAAMLGAVIAEYMGGSDKGIGNALISAQQAGNATETWAIAVVITFAAGIGYFITAVVGRTLTPWVSRTPAT
jgi:ABC-type nitrate/sulfonate/bicarbonate transport system permease component